VRKVFIFLVVLIKNMASYEEVREKFNWSEAMNFVKEDNPVIPLTSHEGEAVIRISKDERERATFHDLKIKALKLGLYLKEIQGVRKGDVIAVLASKKIEQIIVLLATLSIGAIYQPLFTAFGPKANRR
jgi:acetyl-CoA synthetase